VEENLGGGNWRGRTSKRGRGARISEGPIKMSCKNDPENSSSRRKGGRETEKHEWQVTLIRRVDRGSGQNALLSSSRCNRWICLKKLKSPKKEGRLLRQRYCSRDLVV